MEKEATDLKSRQPLHTLYRALDLENVFCSLICIREMKSKYTVQNPHRIVETDRPFLVSYSCCTIKSMQDFIVPKYVYYVLKTPMIKAEINRYINKTTQPNVGLASIKRFLFPLPPLAEQKRIVARLEELLPLCERLKKTLGKDCA